MEDESLALCAVQLSLNLDPTLAFDSGESEALIRMILELEMSGCGGDIPQRFSVKGGLSSSLGPS